MKSFVTGGLDNNVGSHLPVLGGDPGSVPSEPTPCGSHKGT